MLLRNSGDMKQVQWNIVENHDEDQGQILVIKTTFKRRENDVFTR